ncbi:enoyl-CoA hydratase/isomerase family protein [Oleispirillum naphthae]|uniref:enoyl-CoA hydratase/isomerase family protein n=1 Tax=Oleispirillum naphthae TaxID=2838853 RepID=UPI0030822AB3
MLGDTATPAIERRGRLGTVTLRRKAAMNALTHADALAIHQALDDWEADAETDAVLICAAPGRTFCAGVDTRMVYAARLAGETDANLRLFAACYRLTRRLAAFRKPLVRLIDGTAAAAGSGLALLGGIGVVGENLRLLVPGCGFGWFPDGGINFVLSRLPDGMGEYLALTGAAIGAADAVDLGLATAHVPSTRFAALRAALEGAERLPPAAVRAIVEAHRGVPPEGLMRAHAGIIGRIFSEPTVEGIAQALAAETGDFAATARELMARRCPTSLCVALAALRRARNAGLEAALETDYRIAARFVRRCDVYEGIRAAFEDRDGAPVWLPGSVESVHQDIIDACFASLPEEREDAGSSV